MHRFNIPTNTLKVSCEQAIMPISRVSMLQKNGETKNATTAIRKENTKIFIACDASPFDRIIFRKSVYNQSIRLRAERTGLYIPQACMS